MNTETQTTLSQLELRALTQWCGRRDMFWSVANIADSPAMVLTPRDARGPWQSMLLILGKGELRLENDSGETLASASDLPALLDAVEGGVAEPPVRHARIAALAIPAATLLGYIL